MKKRPLIFTTTSASCFGERDVLFPPSSYRRAVKYGHRDTASEILRTDVLSRLSAEGAAVSEQALFIVTFPAALAERVPRAVPSLNGASR